VGPDDHGRIKREGQINGTGILVEVMTGVNGTLNAGHVCHQCVLKVLARAVK
jgi:hypothetical protein